MKILFYMLFFISTLFFSCKPETKDCDHECFMKSDEVKDSMLSELLMSRFLIGIRDSAYSKGRVELIRRTFDLNKKFETVYNSKNINDNFFLAEFNSKMENRIDSILVDFCQRTPSFEIKLYDLTQNCNKTEIGKFYLIKLNLVHLLNEQIRAMFLPDTTEGYRVSPR